MLDKQLQNNVISIIQGVYARIRSESQTYGELKENIKRESNEILWKNGRLGELVSGEIQKHLEQEIDSVINTLPIKENARNLELVNEIDLTIQSLCKKAQNEELAWVKRVGLAKAAAVLAEARTKLI